MTAPASMAGMTLSAPPPPSPKKGPEAIRRRRLRGPGSVFLGRAAGIDLFLPWLDWILTFAILGGMLFLASAIDPMLAGDGGLALTGYLGIAILVQAALSILGSVIAAQIVGLRIASLQLGPARRVGRFVTYADRARKLTLFYPLRALPVLLGWLIANAAWRSGASPVAAIIAQICLLSLAFAWLPIPGSDGHRTAQAISWWLTSSIRRGAAIGATLGLVLCALVAWYSYRAIVASTGITVLWWMLVLTYSTIGALSHLGGLQTSRRLADIDTCTLADMARPLALAVGGTPRGDYPPYAVTFVADDTRLYGVCDPRLPASAPVDAALLPCPAWPAAVDENTSMAEAYLGLFDEGVDAVALESGGRYAALTLEDCARFLISRKIPFDGHLGVG